MQGRVAHKIGHGDSGRRRRSCASSDHHSNHDQLVCELPVRKIRQVRKAIDEAFTNRLLSFIESTPVGVGTALSASVSVSNEALSFAALSLGKGGFQAREDEACPPLSRRGRD